MKLKKLYLVMGMILVVSIIIIVFLKVKNAPIEKKWLNYLLEMDIQEITLTRNLDGEKKNLDLDQLKKIFKKLDNYDTKRVFTEILKDESEYTLSVYYLINGDGHYLIVNDNAIDISNDNNLTKLIDEDYLYNEYDESATIETQIYYYAFDNYSKKVFSRYFD